MLAVLADSESRLGRMNRMSQALFDREKKRESSREKEAERVGDGPETKDKVGVEIET